MFFIEHNYVDYALYAKFVCLNFKLKWVLAVFILLIFLFFFSTTLCIFRG